MVAGNEGSGERPSGPNGFRPAAGPGQLPERHSARVVLADAADRILLVRVVDDGTITVAGGATRPATYWITPGGGTEPGESLDATVRREVFEETGIATFTLGPLLWVRRVEVTFRAAPMLFVEHYFAGRTGAVTTSFAHLDALEHDVLVEHRWWTPAEIDEHAHETTFFPPNLAELGIQALAAG